MMAEFFNGKERAFAFVKIAVTVLAAALCAFPWLVLVGNGISPLVVASESIGYRLFHSFRILSGDPGFVFLPQGLSLGLFHHLFNFVLGRFLVENLEAWILWFSVATYLFSSVIIAAVFLRAVFDCVLDNWDRLVLFVVPIFAIFSCRSGITHAVMPDYLFFELGLAVFAFWIFLHFNRKESQASQRAILLVLLAIFAGVAAATKITLVLTAFFVSWPVIFPKVFDWKQLIFRLGVYGAVCGAVFIGITVVYYLFDFGDVARWVSALLQFSKKAGAEDLFWASLWNPGGEGANPGADYGYGKLIFVIWLAAVLSTLFFCRHSWREGRSGFAVAVLALICGSVHALGLMTRPAGTTLWEVSLFAVCSAGACISTWPQFKFRSVGAFLFASVLLIYSFAVGPAKVSEILPVSSLADSSRKVWAIHRSLENVKGKKIIWIPNNNHTIGTVEEALLKGFSDFPTWEMTTGREFLQRIAPGFCFVQNFDEVEKVNAVMWINIPDRKFLEEENDLLVQTKNSPNYTLQSWDLKTYPWWQRTVNVLTRTSPSKKIK